jgi:Tfp pilus assembly protein PilX
MHRHSIRPTLGARLADERGVTLVVALLAMLLLTALGMALTLTTMTEGKIANNYASAA